jgi:O-antigen/teichoic acid export membrane protein
MGHNIRACCGINTIQGIKNVFESNLINRAKRNIFYKILAEATKVLPALLFIYIARELGGDDFGKLSFAFSFAGMCILIADFGLNRLLVRNVSRQKELTGKYVANIYVLKIALTIMSVIAMGLFVVLAGYTQEMITLVMVFGGAMFFRSLLDVSCAVFNAHEQMDKEAVLKGISHILLFVSGAAVLVLGFGLFELSNVFLIVYLISSILGYFMVYKCIVNVRPCFNLRFWYLILKESLPIALTVTFGVIYVKVDIVMLSLIRGDNVEIGWYSAAVRIIELLHVIPAIIASAIFPIFSILHKDSMDSLGDVYKTSFKYLLVIALPVVVGTFLLSDHIIDLVYGEEYVKAIPALKILVCSLIFIFVNYILLNILVAADRQRNNAIVTGICLFVNISLNMCLIPCYGYLGAGYATVITEIVLFAMCWYYATKYVCKVNIFAVFSRPLMCVTIMGVFIVLTTARLNLALVIILSAFIYFTCLLLFRFFTKDDKLILLHLLGRSR